MNEALSARRRAGIVLLALALVLLISAALPGSGTFSGLGGLVDTNPPGCLAFVPGSGPARIKVIFRDTDSGLDSIDVVNTRNISSIDIPSFPSGWLNGVTSTAAVSNPASGARVQLRGTDVAGNTKTCTGNYMPPEPYFNP